MTAEVNRPTFASLTPPMLERCRFIAFEALQERLKLAKDLLQFLKPEFLDAISEGTQIEEVCAFGAVGFISAAHSPSQDAGIVSRWSLRRPAINDMLLTPTKTWGSCCLDHI